MLLQLLHHSIFCVLFIIPVFLDDIFAARLTFILDIFVPHEFLLYAALLAHRLSKSNRVVKTTTYVALAWYTVTRIAQVRRPSLQLLQSSPLTHSSLSLKSVCLR